MDQVSRPMMIALAVTIVLAALWLVVLRPKAVDVADTPAAPVSAVAKANDAAATAVAANADPARGADGVPAAPATAALPPGGTIAATKPAAEPKPDPSDLDAGRTRQAAVVRDIRRGKVVVLLFWNAEGVDDIATRDAVRGLSRHGGKLAVHVVPIGRVGEYESITRGVTVNQSPTTLVIDRRRRSRAIVGLSERGELTQAVGDAFAGRQ